MYKIINKNDFHDAFYKMGRKDDFSYDGLNVLFEYLEEVYPDMELDVIDLCCSYSEYKSLEEYNIDNNSDYEDMYELNQDIDVLKIDDESFIIRVL